MTCNLGWVVEYLVTVRQGDIAAMGYVSTGFGAGMTLSRLLLAEPTHRFGERRMVFGYIAISIGLQLVFWLVPNIVASAVAVSLMGFFLGPLFATGMSVASKLFPRKVQAAALGEYKKWYLDVAADEKFQALSLYLHKPEDHYSHP